MEKKPLYKVGDYVGCDLCAEMNSDEKVRLYPFIKGKIIAIEPPENEEQSYEYLIEISEANMDFREGDWDCLFEDNTYLSIEADIYEGSAIERTEKQLHENIIKRAACHGISMFLERQMDHSERFIELNKDSNLLKEEIMNGNWDIDLFKGPVKIKDLVGFNPKFITTKIYS